MKKEKVDFVTFLFHNYDFILFQILCGGNVHRNHFISGYLFLLENKIKRKSKYFCLVRVKWHL